MTPDQRKVARHALGLTNNTTSYRNRFLAAAMDKKMWDTMTEDYLARIGVTVSEHN